MKNEQLTLEKIKKCIAFKGAYRDAWMAFIDGWYKIEIKSGKTEQEALQATLDKLGEKMLSIHNEKEQE